MKSLKQHLATLNYQQACEILGDNGETLLRQGGFAEIDISSQVSLGQHIFWLNLADASVTLTAGEKGLQSSCSECLFTCHHIGSALSVVLEEKEALGLAEVSPFSEDNHGGELIKRALNERLERSKKESMELVLLENEQGPWAHYRVFSQNSGKTYSLTIHGLQRGEAYCSCPDYKCNTLGTCKHLLFALNELRTRFSENQLSQAYERRHCAVHIVYGNEAELRVSLPDKNAPQELQRFANQAIFDVAALMKAVQSAMSRGFEINVYPDAAEYIDAQLYKQRMHGLVEEIQRQPQMHPLRKSLLKEPLLAYQLEGIAFAAGARRSIIADDMGLGKTIQGIGLAELLRQQAGISKVLVISPASLKNQWNSEIERFSSLTSCVVQGSPEERSELYGTAFFTICNYEQVLRDVPFIERKKWDLIILDEGQRIKNLESQTSKVVKSLKSDYALVLSGTPLENRLEDLFSVVNFVDARLLGPAFQFFEEYQECDNKGRLLAYKNLDQLRTKLKPVLLRRTRKQELPQLPALTVETRLIPPSEAQQSMDVANRRIMQSIITKSHISEMDLLRLRKAMTNSRMAADCTSLVDPQGEESSSKLAELQSLLEQICSQGEHKLLIFSEWIRMLDKIEEVLNIQEITFVRIDGNSSARQKEQALQHFNNQPEIQVLLCSSTAGVGLNLQEADTLINVDIPWNPATMEQRIARAHRYGQTKPVQAINLVTAGTIEERLLANFEKKQELFSAVLDPETDICEVSMSSGMGDLRSKLQGLLTSPSKKSHHRETVIALPGVSAEVMSLSGGRLMNSALNFLGDLLQTQGGTDAPEGLSREIRRLLLNAFQRNEKGELEITLRFADDEAVDRLAVSLARMTSMLRG